MADLVERIVEINRRVWDEWPVGIDAGNVEEVRRAAAIAVAAALEAEASEGERRGLEKARLEAIVAWHGNHGTEWRRKDNGPTAMMTRPEEYVPLRALIPEAPVREGE